MLTVGGYTSGCGERSSNGLEGLRDPGRPRKSEGKVLTPLRGGAPRQGRAGAAADRRARAQDGAAAARPRFFSASLAACQGRHAGERRAWRDGVYAVIQAMTACRKASSAIERMCRLAGVSRAGYYRHWQPRRRARRRRRCATRCSGWRWPTGTTAIAGSDRAAAARRLVRQPQAGAAADARGQPAVPARNGLSCRPRPTLGTAGAIVPEPGARPAADRPRPALGGRHHLRPAARGVRLSGGRARCLQPQGGRLGDGRPSAGRAWRSRR